MFSRRASIALPAPTESALAEAMSDVNISPDMGANMRVVDICNGERRPEMLAEIVRQIRKVVQSKNYKAVLMALHLCEMLVMNCKLPVHTALADAKFLAAMERLVKESGKKGTHDAGLVNDKALELLQAWGEAFLAQGGTATRPFVETYHRMKAAGTVFPRPQMDPTAVPVLTPTGSAAPPAPPARTVAPPSAGAAGAGGRADSGGPAVSLTALNARLEALPAVDEPFPVLVNVLGVLCGMIDAASSARELSTDDTIKEMVNTCTQLERRLQETIESLIETNPAASDTLFELNDVLQGVMGEYDYVCRYGPRPKPAPAPARAPAAAAPAPGPIAAAPAVPAGAGGDGFDFLSGADESPARAAPRAAAPAPVRARAPARATGGTAHAGGTVRLAAPGSAGKPPKPRAAPVAIPVLAPPPSDARARRNRTRSHSGSSAGHAAAPAAAAASASASSDVDLLGGLFAGGGAAPTGGAASATAAVPTPSPAPAPAPAAAPVPAPAPAPATDASDPFAALAHRRYTEAVGSHQVAAKPADPFGDAFFAGPAPTTSAPAATRAAAPAPAAARASAAVDPFASVAAPARQSTQPAQPARAPPVSAAPTSVDAFSMASLGAGLAASAAAAPPPPYPGTGAAAPAPAGGAHNPFDDFDAPAAPALAPAPASAVPAASGGAAPSFNPFDAMPAGVEARGQAPANPEDPFSGVF